MADILVRTLKNLGYTVTYVMNVTDVGHLTGDNHGDADTGEDRLEKASKKEGRSAWQIAAAYTSEFIDHMTKLNISQPTVLCKATDHIPEQISMIQKLEEKGFAYRISDGIYFDTKAFEKMGFRYGELSTMDEIKEGARVERNPEKRDPRDFALWKFSQSTGDRRQMEWESPWGVGFPGWHIECSAMSTKYLGSQFDIHTGGEDLRQTHHPNEIAQAEGATGKHPFVHYWVHGAFLLVDGGRMGKSLGNAYTVQDIIERGYDPLALRYFYMTGHYRKQLNFTWESLAAAAAALTKLRRFYIQLTRETERVTLSAEKLEKVNELGGSFRRALERDLDMPGALAIVWETVKSNIPSSDKRDLLESFDDVLGLRLRDSEKLLPVVDIPEDIKRLAAERIVLRQNKQWDEADRLRNDIASKGFAMDDKPDGTYDIIPIDR
jgi:cysteinyl-tRNA synthetase